MTNDITIWLIAGLSFLGYLYILFKTGEWLASIIWKQWDKSRKEERKQKAINELYDAFNLSDLTDGDTMKVATKGGLTIMMIRK
ncbi:MULTISPECIES: DUF4752 family protein [Yersinia]|uniref:DUF4752 family protein n=1 Tax=Yersinia TaxID=629 RepID=UPI0005DC3059|nr:MULTISPECIES: DUF4752 family protein [Yersinia]RXA93626.1 DUF4752 family protein [Yersinia sp. 2105 StPb PI]CNI28885.1 Uncharacterised protein [Yersinia frederiksenii]